MESHGEQYEYGKILKENHGKYDVIRREMNGFKDMMI